MRKEQRRAEGQICKLHPSPCSWTCAHMLKGELKHNTQRTSEMNKNTQCHLLQPMGGGGVNTAQWLRIHK